MLLTQQPTQQAYSHRTYLGHMLIPYQITVYLTHEVGGRSGGGVPIGKWVAISRKKMNVDAQ